MKFGVVLPFSDARLNVPLAAPAEAAGWDGVFLPELVWGADPWVQLSAMAVGTTRIRLGTMLTPLPWVNPWTLAGQAAALDNLSGGRVILTVGLGAPDAGARGFPLEMDRRVRAERLDEGLDILTGLWSGEPFAYEGKHFRIDPTPFAYNAREEGMPPPPPPLQRPRITTWVVGIWPRTKSMSRALRYDGIVPGVKREDANQASPEEVEEIAAYAAERRVAGMPFDIVVEGESEPGAASEQIEAYARAGATWWIESRWGLPSNADGAEQLRERIAAGPARVDM